MADKDNMEVPDGMTALDEALSRKPVEETGKGPSLKMDCNSCDSAGTVEKDDHNVYENKELNLKLIVPAYVCSSCGTAVYEVKEYRNVLQAEEIASGRPYVKVAVKNGRISKYSVH